MGDQGKASSSSSWCRGRRGPVGFGLALARLVRRMRRRSKMLLCTAAPAASSRYCPQYDPLSYARNFDRDGFGTALQDRRLRRRPTLPPLHLRLALRENCSLFCFVLYPPTAPPLAREKNYMKPGLTIRGSSSGL
ncbi:uncharacterized protein [Triticum aestivum]|uniref:uncharacterized protein n=1 Tax=Triticum aestivum TaxID=4565 RepID=UPI0008429BD4|nr:uncharacterized protein LOC123155495 [Triticum aestivum]